MDVSFDHTCGNATPEVPAAKGLTVFAGASLTTLVTVGRAAGTGAKACCTFWATAGEILG